MKRLNMMMNGHSVGHLDQDDHGKTTLTAPPTEDAPRLSLAFAPSSRPVSHRLTRAYIEGLLPENEIVRRATAERTGANANNPFSLLEKIGRDCPGAVQFFPEDVEASELEGPLKPIDEEQIGRRLKGASSASGIPWIVTGEHWSLGGQQAKFALRYENGHWFEACGSQATTHIFKPGITELRSQALIEHLTMRALSLTGQALTGTMPFPEIAESSFTVFDRTPAIVVTRYDRFRDETGHLYRIHQEDFCQSTSTLPRDKYRVTAADVVSVLRKTGTLQDQIDLFARGVLLNWIVAAPDGHAKNFSAILTSDSPVLAPLYDVATGLGQSTTYDSLAMGIGGKTQMPQVHSRHILRFADALKVDGDSLLGFATASARIIPMAFKEAIDEVLHSLRAETTEHIQRVEAELAKHCQSVLRQLD
ncbi:HipA domain-containing protein [Schaalia cardiffensis]|uniref:HipA domain-containing protein n=1 Tax=Schaalia cardiffensis TaxID=181487 RepID=UPI0023F13F3D|nr:HipA domain-containing protein [Schaalia cardiffensis]